MDYVEAARRLLGLQSGGVSSHPKRKSLITPQMREDSESVEAWRKSGKTVPLYQYFPNANPKAT